MRPADALPEDVRGVLARVHNPEYAHRFTHDGYCASDEPLNHGPCDCSHRETVADVSLLAATVERLAADKARTCEWREPDGYHDDAWESACGKHWTFLAGGVEENEVKFCVGCGGRVVTIPFVPQRDDHDAIDAARRATTTDQGEG